MTLQGQLAQSAHSARAQTMPPIADYLPSVIDVNAGLLGNKYIQVHEMPVDTAMEMYRRLISAARPPFRLAILKRQKFVREGSEERIHRSLAALNAAQPTNLTLAQWKAILEEIEDDD